MRTLPFGRDRFTSQPPAARSSVTAEALISQASYAGSSRKEVVARGKDGQ
jgi:hypothetical protein